MEKFKETTTLKEALENKEAGRVLAKFNFPCLGCGFASLEAEKLKLGEICRLYGIDSEKLLKALNKIK